MAGNKVIMPSPQYGTDALNRKRDGLIQQYGSATVAMAEYTAVLDIFIKLGIINMSEYLDIVEYRCQSADRARQEDAARKLRV
jgi:hypothetical protein